MSEPSPVATTLTPDINGCRTLPIEFALTTDTAPGDVLGSLADLLIAMAEQEEDESRGTPSTRDGIVPSTGREHE
jgi:hypothetical protein